MKKRALIVGINYVGTGHELRGCINDANNVKAYLETQGFTDIELMLEKDATTANILAGLKRLVDDAWPGDVLVFHYSGHGSQVPSTLEEDKLDEIICPVDLNWIDKVITDNELKAIFNPVPNGVNVTVILDCCHSGNALDQVETAKVNPTREASSATKVRVMKKNMKNRYLPMPAKIERKAKKMKLRDWNTSRDINQSALLIAACQPNQTSADATIAGKPCGAGTYALLRQLEQNPNSTYQEIIDSMNGFMMTNNFTQRPQLDGSSNLYGRKFLDSWVDVAPAVPATPVEPVVTPVTPVSDSGNNGKDKKQLIIVGAIVVAVVLFVLFA